MTRKRPGGKAGTFLFTAAEKTGKTVVLPRTLLARVISEVTDV